jgi:hypothetical protein
MTSEMSIPIIEFEFKHSKIEDSSELKGKFYAVVKWKYRRDLRRLIFNKTRRIGNFDTEAERDLGFFFFYERFS